MPLDFMPVSAERPFKYCSRNGTRFAASRCDFREGVTATIPRSLPELPRQTEKLMQDVAEMIGYHALNVHEHLHSGFPGYDTVRFTIEIEEGALNRMD